VGPGGPSAPLELGKIIEFGIGPESGMDPGTRFLLWSLNPFASLSLPTICCPWFACSQSSPL
jgi:hypothetical protein